MTEDGTHHSGGTRQADPRVTDDDVDSAIGAYSIVTMNGGSGRDRMRAGLETALEPTGLVGRAVADELDRLAGELSDHMAWLKEHKQDRLDVARVVGVEEALRIVQTAAAEWREGRR